MSKMTAAMLCCVSGFVSGVVDDVVVGMVVVIGQSLADVQCYYRVSTMTTPISPRVLLLIYNPIIESRGRRRLHDVLGWNDADDLAHRYMGDVRTASHGIVNYRIVERMELNRYPTKVDGFRYTDAAFLKSWQARRGFHDPDTADYPTMLRDADFVRKLEADLVDELWLFGFPYAGFYESCMGGRGAIWCNGPVIAGTQNVGRKFVVMGFNYERGVGEMLEDLGHRAENIMEYVFRAVPAHENLWHRFIQHDQTHPGHAACGNVHFAPNSRSDYDWGFQRPVLSTADDWLNYPNLTGQAKMLDCDAWGQGDIRQHHLWWMKRFPHVDGANARGILHNWWRYIVGLEWPHESARDG
jgi:hypothetical protein